MKTAFISPDRLERIALVVALVHVLVVWLSVNWGGPVMVGKSNSSRWLSPGEFKNAGRASSQPRNPLDLPGSTLSGEVSIRDNGSTRLEIRVVKMAEHMGAKLSNESDLTIGTVGLDMSAIDAAIVAAFRHHWVLPPKWREDIRNQNVVMDVSILRDGQVKGALLVKSSGAAEIDVSALRAAERIKNIGMVLPSEFLGDRYEVRMHFHAEQNE